MGDELFRKQKVHSALQQYNAATRFAPDRAEGYFRQGHALVATSNFDLAVQAFKRGLKTDSKIAKSDFLLSEIYGDAKIAKTAHLESLASAALDREGDSDLMFLLGVFLHFDGESKRAVKFFQRASDLAGADNVHLAHFLPRVERKREAPVEPEIHLVGFGRDT
jgi:tetratricopeptide (TPR) repeat protein